MAKKTLMLLDGFGLIWKCLNMQKVTIVNKDCYDVSVVYKFIPLLAKLLNDWSPDDVVIIWDDLAGRVLAKKQKEYPGYKEKVKNKKLSSRDIRIEALTDRMVASKKFVEQAALFFGCRSLYMDYAEARDVIAAFCIDPRNDRYKKIIVTTDRYLLQLADITTIAYLKRDYILFSSGNFDRQFGYVDRIPNDLLIPFDVYLIYSALLGNRPDNIKSCKGVGKNGVVRLLVDYKEVMQGKKLSNINNFFSYIKRLVKFPAYTKGTVKALKNDSFRQLAKNHFFMDIRKWAREYKHRDLLEWAKYKVYDEAAIKDICLFSTIPNYNRYITLAMQNFKRRYEK